ncbi:unnamed protein product [Prorocentrum cordatum]|uniref:Uncharacterized protein n=1 Tax=Prorocentrum cordatum TaxID=2364126 RepID=A0ABN9T5K2_9DINO|nr:unnamed protein product [Polarella glacialis]
MPKAVRTLQSKLIRNVSCAEHHVAAVSESGVLFTWGKGQNGRLGHGGADNELLPKAVEALVGHHVVQVSCGDFHTACVILNPPHVYTWGLGLSGRLGHGNEADCHLPTPVEALASVQVGFVACGGHHSAVIVEPTGQLMTWGGGAFGKLGHGNRLAQTTPKMVAAVQNKKLVQVSLGPHHAAALTQKGEVYTWGQAGRLGHASQGAEVDEMVPRQVMALSQVFVLQVSCGHSHCAVVTETGDVWAWGSSRAFGHTEPSAVVGARRAEPDMSAACAVTGAALRRRQRVAAAARGPPGLAAAAAAAPAAAAGLPLAAAAAAGVAAGVAAAAASMPGGSAAPAVLAAAAATAAAAAAAGSSPAAAAADGTAAGLAVSGSTGSAGGSWGPYTGSPLRVIETIDPAADIANDRLARFPGRHNAVPRLVATAYAVMSGETDHGHGAVPNVPTMIKVLSGKAIVQVACGVTHSIALSDYRRLTGKAALAAVRSMGAANAAKERVPAPGAKLDRLEEAGPDAKKPERFLDGSGEGALGLLSGDERSQGRAVGAMLSERLDSSEGGQEKAQDGRKGLPVPAMEREVAFLSAELKAYQEQTLRLAKLLQEAKTKLETLQNENSFLKSELEVMHQCSNDADERLDTLRRHFNERIREMERRYAEKERVWKETFGRLRSHLELGAMDVDAPMLGLGPDFQMGRRSGAPGPGGRSDGGGPALDAAALADGGLPPLEEPAGLAGGSEQPPGPDAAGARPDQQQRGRSAGRVSLWPGGGRGPRAQASLPGQPRRAGGPGARATALPGYGAVATAAVEPSEGSIQPGGFVELRVSLRVLKEVDLSAHFVVELPVALNDKEPAAAPPLRVAVVGAVRSPQVELRRTSMLDYGVVRAHARQSRQLKLSNPSELPVLLRLRHLRGEAPAVLAAAPGAASSSAPPSKLEPAAEAHFPLHTHQEVVDFFAQAMSQGCGGDAFKAMPGEPREVPAPAWVHSRDGCMDKSGRRMFSEGRAFRGRKTCFQGETSNGEVDREARVEDSEDFVFTPSCMVLWPHESAEVDVLLRTSAEGKYRALLEAVGFDSLQAQCVEVWAEVQLPSVRVSTQHVHFPKSYLNVATSAYQLELTNMSDLPANFRWEVPMTFGSGLEVQIGPTQGTVPPRSTFGVALVATPTRKGPGAEVQCKLYVQDVLQALVLRVTANVYGCQVDYAVAPLGAAMPQICHQPRELDTTPSGTSPVLAGPAQPGMPMVDFGTMELLKSRSLQLTLYNRTAIATPFSLKVAKFKAYDPLEKGKCIGDLLDAATRLHALGAATDAEGGGAEEKLTFSTLPEPAAQGRKESTLQPTQRMKFDPKSRRALGKSGTLRRKQQKWLLDDKHEKQTFRSSVGEAFANQKEQREAGVVALKLGRGWAVKVDPATDWLQPFGSTVVTLTCYSDLPGEMEDELIVKIQQMEEHSSGSNHFRVPIRLKSFGNPLYLPLQQVGVNYDPPGELDPPQLLCGVMTPIDRIVTRSFKVGNHSSVKMRIGWNVLPKKQVETISSDRQLVRIALCKKANCPEDPFAAREADDASATEEDAAADAAAALVPPPFEFDMWAQDPPEVQDPFAGGMGTELPVRVEPAEAVVPAYGTATFTVTMTATKPTATAANHYRYHLLGKGRFTADRETVLAATEEANSPRGSPRLLTAGGPGVEAGGVERTMRGRGPAALPPAAASEVLDLPSAPPVELGDDDSSDSDAEPAATRGTRQPVQAGRRGNGRKTLYKEEAEDLRDEDKEERLIARKELDAENVKVAKAADKKKGFWKLGGKRKTSKKGGLGPPSENMAALGAYLGNVGCYCHHIGSDGDCEKELLGAPLGRRGRRSWFGCEERRQRNAKCRALVEKLSELDGMQIQQGCAFWRRPRQAVHDAAVRGPGAGTPLGRRIVGALASARGREVPVVMYGST